MKSFGYYHYFRLKQRILSCIDDIKRSLLIDLDRLADVLGVEIYNDEDIMAKYKDYPCYCLKSVTDNADLFNIKELKKIVCIPRVLRVIFVGQQSLVSIRLATIKSGNKVFINFLDSLAQTQINYFYKNMWRLH